MSQTYFLHYEVTWVIIFYKLNFNMILTILNLIFKAFNKTLIWGREKHNTAYSSLLGDSKEKYINVKNLRQQR